MGQLFSKKNREVFSTPLGMNNPVTVQVLGICSALAVTAKLYTYVISKRFQNFTYDGYQSGYHNQLNDDTDTVGDGFT